MTESRITVLPPNDGRDTGFWVGVFLGAAGTLALAVALGTLVFGVRVRF